MRNITVIFDTKAKTKKCLNIYIRKCQTTQRVKLTIANRIHTEPELLTLSYKLPNNSLVILIENDSEN